MSEFSYKDNGIVEEFEGDITVPEEATDALGWTHEAFDDKAPLSAKNIENSAAEAALRLFEYDVVEPMMLDQTRDDAESEVKGESLTERIAQAKERFHFKPTTHEELNNLRSLTTKNNILGSASHLSQVQRHNVRENKKAVEATKNLAVDEQVKLDPTLPRRTVEKIISQYVGYAESALSQRGLLLNFQTILSDRYKRSEPVSAVSVLQDWTMDASTSVPIKALIKSQAIEKYVIDDTDKKSPLQIDFDKMKTAEVRALGEEYMRGLKVGQLQDQTAALVREQAERFTFWTNALKDSLPNSAATSSASAALRKFGLI